MTVGVPSHWLSVSDNDDFLGSSFRSRGFQNTQAKHATVCHLINHKHSHEFSKAILYLHGYTDYFFQSELAEDIIKNDYAFYALDLQGYGRSIRPFSTPNECDSLDQYFDDLNIALTTIKEDGINEVVILAHSTGGLIASRFLQSLQQSLHNSAQSETLPAVTGLILNSPFICLPFTPHKLKKMTRLVSTLVHLFPFYKKVSYKDKVYAKTLHKKFGGEWQYRLDFKPSNGFGLSFAWLKQVIKSQNTLVQQKLHIPTLLCCSEKSTYTAQNTHEVAQGDGALDVESMQQTARSIYTHLEIQTIPQGFHDLYLSKATARQHYLSAIKHWLTEQKPPSN
ncbi:alpha/beta hydrolase [Marinomonas sp. 2405UD68-3]|uniref:alpha/beta hydrolase n=1 Tax=Marinomonas sp. 2405UD68-3 TaxID=3391835 RepID=UPI0039C9B0BE